MACEFGWAPLMYAAGGSGHVAVVQALLAAGAGTKQRCSAGMTVLMLAVAGGHMAVAGKLFGAVAGQSCVHRVAPAPCRLCFLGCQKPAANHCAHCPMPMRAPT
jgi:hypothetical protein